MPSWLRRARTSCPPNTRRRGWRPRPWWPNWLRHLRQAFRISGRRRGYFVLALEALEDRALPSGGITEYLIPSGFSFPQGIASGPDGALWFTEFVANKVGRVTTSGTFTEYMIPTGNAGATGITAGPDGALWFVEGTSNKIGRLTTAGAFTEYNIPTA